MLNCRFCKFSTAGKTAPGVKMKLESQKGAEDGCGGGAATRREVCGYGRNIFMGYLNRDNDTKVRSYRRRNVTPSPALLAIGLLDQIASRHMVNLPTHRRRYYFSPGPENCLSL